MLTPFRDHIVESAIQRTDTKAIIDFWKNDEKETLKKTKDKRFPKSVILRFPKSPTEFILVRDDGTSALFDESPDNDEPNKSLEEFKSVDQLIKHLRMH